MRPSDIHVGRTYVGKSGRKRRVFAINGDGEDRFTTYRPGESTAAITIPLAVFAYWAIAEVPE